MQHALAYGRRGMGQVWPNPAVGCVIVNHGLIVGRGRTATGGRPHAETEALAQAGVNARRSTVYVTLEPCAHTGQTPPCARALIDADVKRVVIATTDPDPRVSGKGIKMLQDAGIDVVVGVCQAEALQDHAGFISRITRNRPFVTLKMAETLDGRIATATGESQWITSVEARRAVHAMRARHDAMLTGAGTARIDNPRLNVRNMGFVKQPVRVILATNLDLPMDGYLAQSVAEQPLWLCHGNLAKPQKWQEIGAETIECEIEKGFLNPATALEKLAERGITRVFCEGGGMLASSLIKAGLVDELVVFSAGSAFGADGTPSLAAFGVRALKDAPAFQLKSVQQIGPDILHRWQPA